MQKIVLALVASLALAAALPCLAFAKAAPVDGQVTKVNTNDNKITLRHGPIKNLDMNSMTFRVRDPAMLKQVKVGDKVKFEADRGNGRLTVVEMQKAK